MQYAIPARITRTTTVTVEADSEADALARFHAFDWVDSGELEASITDFEAIGTPKEVKA